MIEQSELEYEKLWIELNKHGETLLWPLIIYRCHGKGTCARKGIP